jgi:hypothetical protein
MCEENRKRWFVCQGRACQAVGPFMQLSVCYHVKDNEFGGFDTAMRYYLQCGECAPRRTVEDSDLDYRQLTKHAIKVTWPTGRQLTQQAIKN